MASSNPLVLLEKENDSNKLIFHKNHLKTVLSYVKNRPICVISIAAHSSQGSSLFLGYLLKYFQVLENRNDTEEQNLLHPFTWEEGQRPSEDQVGTWIVNKPFIINDSAFILLYSQCSEDEFYSEETAMNTLVALDLHISCLTIIISSDKLSLEFLSKVATFTNIGKNQENDATQELAFFVPNWTMVSRYPLGGEGGQKLFQKMLDACPDDVQEDISKHFNTIYTHLAPKSGEPKSFKGTLSELDPIFVENLDSFGEWLMSPEAFQSQTLTASGFKNTIYSFLKKMDTISDVETVSDEEFELEPESKLPPLLKGLDSIKDSVPTQEQTSPIEPIRLPNLLSSNTSSEDLNSPAQPSLKRPPAPPPKRPPQRSASTPQERSSSDLETISRKTSAPPSPRRFLSQPAPKTIYSDDDDDSDSIVSSSKTSHQKFIRETIKKYHSTVKTINRKSNADYLTEAALDKAHKIAVKKAIENLRELIGPEKDENTEKRLKSQLQKELITLKEKNEEERQLFLDDLSNDLVQRYKNDIKAVEEKTMQEKSQEFIKQLVMEFEETLEANDDEDKWPVQQLESKLKKIEKKHLAVKEREMEESSELTEMALDFAAKDYLQAMEKGLCSEEVSTKIFIDLHNESREKCLEQLEEDLGAEWENGVEERLDARLLPLVDILQEKYHIESSSNQEEKEERNPMEEIELACGEAVNYYEQEMKKQIENGPYKESFLDEKNEQLVEDICKKYMDYLNCLNIPGSLEEYEEKLRNDLCTVYFPLRAENAQKFEHSILKTKRMSVICLQEYQSIMSQEIGRVQSTEELQSLHEAAYHRAMMILQTAHLAQHDPSFVQNNMTELKNEIEGAFGEIYELYEMKQIKESGDISGELRKCRQFYEDEIRSNQFIKPEELERLHQRVSEKALKTMPNLTEEQKPDLKRRMEQIYMKYVELNSMNSQDQPAVGIDLGTTYCCTAIYAKGKVHVVHNGIGKNTTPSYVAFKNGKEIVGDAAKSQAYSNPENTIFDAKRIIGRKFGDPKLQEDMRLWPFSVVDEQGVPKIAVGDRNLHPEEISAKLLKQLKLDAEAYLGEKVTKAVITVPAYFTDGQRQATIDAGKMAGLNVLSILAEPTAAALAYKLQHSFESRDRNVLIFDLGGGTFDVAVMKTSKGKIDILGVDGDTHLGGEDFDKSLMEYCAFEFKKQHDIDLFEGKDSDNKQKKDEVRRKLKRLQGECEKRKIELAAARIAEVNVDNMHGDYDLSIMVTRETFEDLNAHFFQKTIEIVEKALVAAKLDKSEIDDVVLVGGSTRIPKVQELLKEYFGGKTLDCSINPDEAVAYGAAMNAAMLNGSVAKDSTEYEEIQDVAPMSIGVRKYGGGFSVIIPKGTKTPVKCKQTYRTALDNQISVHITIYQGEDPVAAKNEKLGDFYLNGIPPRKAGAENVDVEMTIDCQGILNVAVVSNSTGIREVSVIENKQRMGKEAIENYLQLEGHAH